MAMKWVDQMPVPETKAASASQAARRPVSARARSRIEKAVTAASRQMIPARITSRKSCSWTMQA